MRLPATVRGVCDGPALTMLVDGRPVAQAVDTVLASGRTGVVGWTDAGRAGAEYRFGQFAVDAPPRSLHGLAATGPRVLFQDTFEHPGSGWRADSLDDTVVEIAGGAYRVWIARDGQKRTLTKPGFGHEGDVVVEVDAVRSAGDSTTAYGIICRSTRSGGYAFLVADDGYHSIMHTGESEWETLAEGAQSPNRIQPGPKRLRAECVGDRLALHLDGQKLLEARHSTSRRGYTDLYVDAYGQGPHEVRFDNFVLRRP
ncbi:MAG: hypothetical protein KY444_02670 [Gemmatimonadetes bacterium]|nr:hypothetical protein [Gemmatimonadota bacterium]